MECSIFLFIVHCDPNIRVSSDLRSFWCMFDLRVYFWPVGFKAINHLYFHTTSSKCIVMQAQHTEKKGKLLAVWPKKRQNSIKLCNCKNIFIQSILS